MTTRILSTDSDTAARHKANYNDLITNNYADRPGNRHEDDELAHIEDTPLFWVSVNGRPIRLSWNQMSDEQRDQHRQAEQRAFFNALNDPCGLDLGV